MAKRNQGKVVGAGLIGAAVGAIAGILFAPHSGKETRRAIGKGIQKAEKSVFKEVKVISKSATKPFRKNKKRSK